MLYDITKLALELDAYKMPNGNYERVLIERDTWRYNIFVINKNCDEDFAYAEGSYLLEWNSVDKIDYIQEHDDNLLRDIRHIDRLGHNYTRDRLIKGVKLKTKKDIQNLLELNNFDGEDEPTCGDDVEELILSVGDYKIRTKHHI